MSTKSKILISVLSLIILGLIGGAFYHILTGHRLNISLDKFRRRRMATSNDSSTTIPPAVMELTQNLTKAENQKTENILAVALGELLITSPEDIMFGYIIKDNFDCKSLKQKLKIFKEKYNGDINSDLLYVRLFRSIAKFFDYFCKDGKYRKAFMQSQDLFVKLHEEFQGCQGRLDWFEKNSTFACDQAHKILECCHQALMLSTNDDKIIYDFLKIFKDIINIALSEPCSFKDLKKTKYELEEMKHKEKGLDWHCIFIIVFAFCAFLMICCLFKNKIVKWS